MEINVLLKSNFSDSVPECYVGSCIFGQVGQNVGLEACAAEIDAFVNIVVSYIDSEGAWFLQVQFAVAEACVPSGIVVGIGGGVLPVFTEYAEVGNRNCQVCAEQFVASNVVIIGVAYEFNVVNAEFAFAEFSCAACIECVMIDNFVIVVRGIETAIASGYVNFFTEVECCFSAIYAVGIAIQPAALVTESDRNTAEANGCSFAKVMVCKQLIKYNVIVFVSVIS
jgi:hypothetical protein